MVVVCELSRKRRDLEEGREKRQSCGARLSGNNEGIQEEEAVREGEMRNLVGQELEGHEEEKGYEE